jgi:hypothetical protein
MPTFLILRRTGPGEMDIVPTAVIKGKTDAEVDEAIKEGATQGEGNYVAVSVTGKVERSVHYSAVVGPPDAE